MLPTQMIHIIKYQRDCDKRIINRRAGGERNQQGRWRCLERSNTRKPQHPGASEGGGAAVTPQPGEDWSVEEGQPGRGAFADHSAQAGRKVEREPQLLSAPSLISCLAVMSVKPRSHP